jgi:probable HAF family extracellular repeat protein
MTDLGTLGGTNSEAVAINEAGQIIGWANTTAGLIHAFVWENGVMTLGSLTGDSESYAVALK